jgi:hypothetical protein
MVALAKDGVDLSALIRSAAPFCRRAELAYPRKGVGRKPEIPDWVIAVLIVAAVLKQRKSKSSQYRFLWAHHEWLLKLLGVDRFPSRTTYFDRYRRAWKLLETAIRLAGEEAIENRWISARCVAVDKSIVPARGPRWNKRQVARGRIPHGADLEATWTYNHHQGWMLGYSYEVVVTAEKAGAVWPLIASAGPASVQPLRTFPAKVPHLPEETRYVLADAGYDGNALAESIEYAACGRRTGRRMLCPQYDRSGMRRRTKTAHKRSRDRVHHQSLREQRQCFFEGDFAQRLMKRRGMKIEPYNDWLKSRFDLHHQVWHRGLDNNKTHLLAATFCYQLLLIENHRQGHSNGCIQWILDRL